MRNDAKIDAQPAINYAHERRAEFLEGLRAFLRIPSVSTLDEHKADMQKAAEWVAGQLEDAGLSDVRIAQTAGHPIVYAETLEAGPDAGTVLYYGHYDVQPVDPIELWQSDPFDPQVRGENIYGRGASDMKGQLVAFLEAVRAISSACSSLPVNLKVMIEGEEETGPGSIVEFIRDHKDLLAFDLCVSGDAGILGPETPSITYALRGSSYFELRLWGPATDLHSGMFGGAVDNPALVLCELIAGMRDSHGRITLPEFYDQVRPLSDGERAELAALPRSDSWWLEKSGAPALFGEEGYTATERATARPMLSVAGILSGFTGQGCKTVLPAKAMAKISIRSVPDQKPESVSRSLRAYLEDRIPPTVRWELEEMPSCPPSILERDSRAVRAAGRAMQAVWGRSPLFTRQGGSIPAVGLIQEHLGGDVLLLGFGLPDDNTHAPNEKQHLPTLHRGVETYIRFLIEVAE